MPPWCESNLGLNVEAVQGKQVSLEWTETSGGLWELWQDPGVSLASLVESASSRDATGTPGILDRTRREIIPPLELGVGHGAPLDVGGTLVLPLSGDGCVGKFLSCSKCVKDHLEVPDVRCDLPRDT